MEILVGKHFKLEIWESCLKTMRVNEVAKFSVPTEHVTAYPSVAQKLREFATGTKKTTEEEQHRCCGMAQMKAPSTGHDDLNELVRNPQPLQFTFDLLSVQYPGEYKKDTWAMNDEEKLNALPHLREEGNQLYQAKQYAKAEEKYAEALGCLENLLIHEQPGSEPWFRLDKLRIPFLLNYSQCKLISEDYPAVIEHTTSVLAKDQINVKALFRRGKAYFACWCFEEAEKDFMRAAELDPSLAAAVKKELKNIEIRQKQKDVEDKEKLKNLFIK
ncbi:AH receptor-interacting protein-like [Anneissia japonica]|uniref:AH receptor-interacting protein-like n=1 Tax=Anneissia japonica TaxID=1529436 RepID=UPI001425A986|nr:AH receptor-interacting protein-like [Anneissia japonica]